MTKNLACSVFSYISFARGAFILQKKLACGAFFGIKEPCL